MDNARLLDERLRRIIREIGGSAGEEIKKNLLNDFGERVRSALEEYAQRETLRLLLALKKAVDRA
jgi:hypothetical protein